MTHPREIKRIPKDEIQVHEELRRLAKSMRILLARKYPDVDERQVVAAKIMREVRAGA